ncbi:MAG TPA: hypothetical protein VK453_26510 [Micromonosporaceae bacterium]|nr:hypothetical protein [Micromonosporaceae bacterium]
MRRHIIIGLITAPALVLGGGSASAVAALGTTPGVAPRAQNAAAVSPTSCAVHRLPLPVDTGNVEVTGGDPGGRYLLGRVLPGATAPAPGAPQVVVWRDGLVDSAPRHPGGLRLDDVNSSGVAVGSAGAYPDAPPSVYRNGVVSPLAGARFGVATAINENGTIAGVSFVGTDERAVALRWASAAAEPVVLPLPAGYTLHSVNGIDEDGTVVGVAARSADAPVGYVWRPDGTGYRLPRPPKTERLVVTGYEAADIRDGKVAVNGWVSDDDGERALFWAFEYDVRAGRYRKVGPWMGYRWVDAAAVNASGWLAGGGGLNIASPSFVTDGGAQELPRLTTPTDVDTVARTLSDDGRVIGGTASRGDYSEPILWRCV